MVFSPERDALECSWSGFLEAESEIDHYMFGVGKAEGDDSVYTFSRINAGAVSYRATGKPSHPSRNETDGANMTTVCSTDIAKAHTG